MEIRHEKSAMRLYLQHNEDEWFTTKELYTQLYHIDKSEFSQLTHQTGLKRISTKLHQLVSTKDVRTKQVSTPSGKGWMRVWAARKKEPQTYAYKPKRPSFNFNTYEPQSTETIVPQIEVDEKDLRQYRGSLKSPNFEARTWKLGNDFYPGGRVMRAVWTEVHHPEQGMQRIAIIQSNGKFFFTISNDTRYGSRPITDENKAAQDPNTKIFKGLYAIPLEYKTAVKKLKEYFRKKYGGLPKPKPAQVKQVQLSHITFAEVPTEVPRVKKQVVTGWADDGMLMRLEVIRSKKTISIGRVKPRVYEDIEEMPRKYDEAVQLLFKAWRAKWPPW